MIYISIRKNIITSFAGLALLLITHVVVADDIQPHVIIDTEFGSIEVELLAYVAPNHVKNFIKLAKSGFYDGTLFHRIIPGFMIQGGDPNTKGDDKSKYGQGGPGYMIDAEFNNQPHVRGVLSMARSQHPDSAGSQFYIVVKESRFLDNKYTVFGRVINGMEVADEIVSQNRGRNDLPLKRIEMKVRVVDDSVINKIKE